MSLDFSFKKYKEILSAISSSQYKIITIDNSNGEVKSIKIRETLNA